MKVFHSPSCFSNSKQLKFSEYAVSWLRVALLVVCVIGVIFTPLVFHHGSSRRGLEGGGKSQQQENGEEKLSLRRLMLARTPYDLTEPNLTQDDYVSRLNELFSSQAVTADGGCSCAGSQEEKLAWRKGAEMIKDRMWLTCSDPRALFQSEKKADDEKRLKNSSSFRRHQKVVSFSIFKKAENESSDWWIEGIVANSRAAKNVYPDWDIRVYHRYKQDTPECRHLCAERKVNQQLNLCYVRNLPRFPAVTNTMGTLWRFLPMIDSGVDIFISRDADSVLNARERSAVKEWLSSNKTLHTMHDHPHHGAPILAGMWGTQLSPGKSSVKTRILLRKLARRMILSSRRPHYKSMDQDLLASHVAWAFMGKDDYMDHSSYLCNTFGFHSRPFPTRRDISDEAIRNGTHFVGALRSPGSRMRLKCPPSCRPSYGKDWTFC